MNATLVAILQNKGKVLSPATADAGPHGWASIQEAANAVAVLRS